MRRVIAFLLIGEALVGIVAWTVLALLDDVPHFVWDVPTLGWSLLATLTLGMANWAVFHSLRKASSGVRFLEPVRRLLEDELFPMLSSIGPLQIVLLAALAGVGEELFFRGLLQPRIGLVLASVAFGVVHGPQWDLWPLALWATVMGWILGLMYVYSNSLTLPILVHAGYDALALAYIRYGVRGNGVDGPGEDLREVIPDSQ